MDRIDKFVTLPHLPFNSQTGLGFHKNVDYISPDLNHTGIRTAFQEKVARPVKPNGRLTYDYKVNAYTKVATPSRALAKLEKNKIRAHYVKNSTYEERLMSLDQKRSALGSACQRQLEQETQFLVPAESLEGSSVLSGQSKKSTNRRKQKHIRPRKIVNQRSIVDLLIDTSEMSICSSAMVPVLTMEDDECTHSASRFSPEQDAGAESVCTLGSSNTLRSTASGLQLKGGAVLSKTEHWDADALRKVYGDDLLLDSVEQQDMSDEAPSS